MSKTACVKSQGLKGQKLLAFFFLGQVKDFGQIDYFVSKTGTDKALGSQPVQCEVAKHLPKEGLELSDQLFLCYSIALRSVVQLILAL